MKIKSSIHILNNLGEQTTPSKRELGKLLNNELSAVFQKTECFVIKTNIIDILDLIEEKLVIEVTNTTISR